MLLNLVLADTIKMYKMQSKRKIASAPNWYMWNHFVTRILDMTEREETLLDVQLSVAYALE